MVLLAGIRNYIHFWQLPLMALLLFGWLWGGGWLLLRSVKKRDYPKRIRLSNCLIISLLAGIGGSLVGVVFFALVNTIGSGISVNLMPVGGVIAFVVMAFTAMLVIYAMLDLPFGRACKAAMLPTAAMMAIFLFISAAAAVPAYFLRQSQLDREQCYINLNIIAQALQSHQRAMGLAADNLDLLVERNYITPELLACPRAVDPEHSYFYLPTPVDPQDKTSRTIVACDLHPQHNGGRNVLDRSGYVRWYDDDEFEMLLKLEENQSFAELLLKAQGK